VTRCSKLVFVLILACFPATASAVIRYVDDSAPSGGTGLSWTSPYNNLQTALTAAVSGDEVRVGGGTYKPGPPGSPTSVTFNLPNGVFLTGGFQGFGGAAPNTQNPSLYPTILSGDLAGNDVPGTFTNYADNAERVVTVSATSSINTNIDRVTIIGADSQSGIGCIGNCVLAVTNCVIQYNRRSSSGGGLSFGSGTLQVVSTIFQGNAASDGGGVSTGTGEFTDCQFISNSAGNTAQNGGGGGFIGAGTLINCTFTGNTCASSMSSFDFGGGALNSVGTVNATGCVFQNHTTATLGGQVLRVRGDTTLTNCQIINNGSISANAMTVWVVDEPIPGFNTRLTLNNCTFHNNRAPANSVVYGFKPMVLNNCTFTSNNSGGATITSRGTLTLIGGTFSGNINDPNTGEISNRGPMEASGSVVADIANREFATLSPFGGTPGDVTGSFAMQGKFNQEILGGGTMVFDIGGEAVGQFDSFTVTGNADLRGGVTLRLVGGYDPPLGACFPLFSASGTVTGQIAVLSTPFMEGKVFRLSGGCAGTASAALAATVVGINELLGTASGVFPLPGSGTALKVADFDNVNGDDIAVVYSNGPLLPGALLILLNDGTGQGFSVASHPVGADPSAVTVGRFDAGPSLDVAVANRGSGGGGTISVLSNNGAGVFAPLGNAIAVGTNLSAIAAGNFDASPLAFGAEGDDIAVAVVGSNANANGSVRIFESDGAGGFVAAATLPTGPNPTSVDPADVDNDRDTDLVISQGNPLTSGLLQGQYSAAVYTNQGTGTFNTRVDQVVGDDPADIVSADLNGDGLPDVVTADRSIGDATGTISVLVNRGDAPGTYLAAALVEVGANPRSVELLNIDNDADLDIAVLADVDGQPSIQKLRNDADPAAPGGAVILTLVETTTVGDNATDISKGDLDNSGAEDLATTDAGISALAGNDGEGGGRSTVAPGPGSLSLLFNSAEAPGTIRVIHSTIASSPTSLVPPGGALTSITPGTRFASFDRPYRSPNGTRWAMVADTDASTLLDAVILVGAGLGGSPRVQEGVSSVGNPPELFGPFDRNTGLRDDGRTYFSTNTNGPTTSDEYVLTVTPDNLIGLWWQEGMQLPDVSTENFGATMDSVHAVSPDLVALRASGTIGTAPDTQDDFLIRGFTIVAQSGVTIPTGQAGGTTFPWENFDTNSFYGSYAGSTWIAKGDLATGTTTSDDVVVVNNQVRLQENSIVPGSGFASPIAAGFAGEIAMSSNGDWFCRGSNVDLQDWMVRNGIVIARTDAVVTPGSPELYDDTLTSTTFFSMTGNNAGDWIIGGVTNAVDINRNGVLVLNGVKVVVREGDRVDLNNNGLPDDDAFISAFANDDLFLTEDRFLYFQSTLRSSAGATLGSAFMRIKIDLTTGCAANIGGGDGMVNVQDLLAVIAAWGPCADVNNCPADIVPPGGDNTVNVQDLLAVIGAWGACP